MGHTISQFQNYYKKYKELSEIHAGIFGSEKRPTIPSLYSENLCRFLYGMEKSSTKEYDATFEGKSVEIKATTSKDGKTTINPYRKFDLLFWLMIDVEKDSLTVKKIPFKNFEKIFSDVNLDNDPEKKIRLNISLKNYIDNSDIDCVDLNNLPNN